MKFQLGLEDFLTEEQKQMLLDLQRLMPRAVYATMPGILREWGVADNIVRAFSMAVWKDLMDRDVLPPPDEAAIELFEKACSPCPGKRQVIVVRHHPHSGQEEWDFCEEHESAECLHENMPEANDETNIIHFSCKNREE